MKSTPSPEYYAWFRAKVDVPAGWAGREIQLFIEGVDDAREVFFNGQSIGLVGTFPPEYRSGLGATMRFPVPKDLVSAGNVNVVAVRVYRNQGRSGFNVAAPVLFGGDQAIRLKGEWELRFGDDPDWSKLSQRESIQTASFSKLEDATGVEQSLKRLADDDGPLSVAETLTRLKHPDDLKIDVVLAEPHIGQPLSIKWDERGRLWVAEYLQYPNPAGLKMVSRDKYLRTVYDKVPPAPPNHFVGADKISIHEDTDGDGVYDKHKTFVEGLSLATSFEFGDGGVYVLNPPYLLFYPDHDGNDVPDGDPEVLLEGFGLEDSHSVANSLRYGPDGWLYSTQGSTVTGHVRRYGSDDRPVHSMGQLVWRYHPSPGRYEIFAEGGGNAFGVEFDSAGRVFSGHNGGDTRGFHYVQGGYYRKGFGKHGALSNPFTFGYFASMTHHKVPRFTHTFVIYEGGALPEKYNGKLFGTGPLQSHVVFSDMQDEGSSFKTKDLGYALESRDDWVRPVDIKVGPDGGIYVADMYEQRIDHASHYQGRIHRESGRIYRVSAASASDNAGSAAPNLASLDTPALIKTLEHKNKWHRETAQRLLAHRGDAKATALLQQTLDRSTGQTAIECLWALYRGGGFTDARAAKALRHPEPLVREWAVRLICDDPWQANVHAADLARLAKTEPNVRVRSQLAASARRLSAEYSFPIVDAMLRRDEDSADIHIPLLLWWAIEDKAEADRELVLSMFDDASLWHARMVEQHLLRRLMRRYATAGKRTDLLSCARLLDGAKDTRHRDLLLAGFEESFKGRSLSDLPTQLIESLSRSGGGSLALRLRQGGGDAVAEAIQKVTAKKTSGAIRAQLVGIFGDIRAEASLPVLYQLLETEKDAAVLRAALAALAAFPGDEIGQRIVPLLGRLAPEVHEVALSTLSSRAAWAKELLKAVEVSKVASQKIPTSVLRKMILHGDDEIQAVIGRVWGKVEGATTGAMVAEISRVAEILEQASGNPYQGKVLYRETCGKCHRLFDEGGEIGPNLTAFKRDEPKQLLANIINPSLEIREGYENMMLMTDDGRAINGFVEDQDNKVIVLKSTEGAKAIIERDSIEVMRATKTSLMPEGLLSPLSDQQLRDLFAYLRASQPLP